MYGIELVLRSPLFTQYVSTNKCGTFLYTKFDCFHIVLPVDIVATNYFQSYRNCMYCTTQENGCVTFNLQKCKIDVKVNRRLNTLSRSSKKGIRRDSIQITSPDNVVPTRFPEGLLRFNVEFYGDCVLRCYYESFYPKSKLVETDCISIIGRYPGLYKGPSDLTFDANADLKNEDPSVSISVTTLTIPKQIDEMLKCARNKSPLWQIVRLEDEVKHLEKKLKAASEDKMFVNYQLEMLSNAHETLKEEHTAIKRKYHNVSSLLYSEMRHVTSKARKAQIKTLEKCTPEMVDVKLINPLLELLDEISEQPAAHDICSAGCRIAGKCRSLKEHIEKELKQVREMPPDNMLKPILRRWHSMDF